MPNRDAQLRAVLSGTDTLTITSKKSFWAERSSEFRLYEDGKEVQKLRSLSRHLSGGDYVFTIGCRYDFVPGKYYQVADCKNEFAPLDLTFLATTKEFDEKYRCEKPLGAQYTPERTTFRVFSPLAVSVTLAITKPGESYPSGFVMTREDCGCHSIVLEGDWDEASYQYIVFVNGAFNVAADPFGYSADANSRHSFVVDPKKVLATPDGRNKLKPQGGLEKSIIYECHVRDMTSKLDIENKGTYAALSCSGLTRNGKPVGLDYLAQLGVTHIQLQPCMDYQTVDDNHPADSYNWGYDPVLYFVPEGSMSLDPDDPYSRVLELRGLANALHSKGLRVVYDVVYNHVFDAYTNPLEQICPGYFFRTNSDGNLSNGSGCGNDLESRRFMCRRLIIESLEHMVDWYGADGFRFDLLGITDRKTTAMIAERLRAKNPEIILYGEGWDMPTALSSDMKSTQANAFKLPDVGFFSDYYRDVIKGGTGGDKMGEKGYLTGDLGKREDFKFAYAACSLNLGRRATFAEATQCISYAECHDNSALWDKMKVCCGGESDETLLRRVKMINAVVALSCGIPFFHAGQEFGMSKKGVENSFCAGDEVNGLDYDLACQRKEHVRFFSGICEFRKSHPAFQFRTSEEIMNRISFSSFGEGGLIVTYDMGKEGFYHVLINPSAHSAQFSFPNYVKVMLTENGPISQEYDFYSQLVLINALSVVVCYQRADGTSGA